MNIRQSLDTYLSLCTDVYELSKPIAPTDAYQFYRSYALETKGPILEPMCGTGRFLLPLIEEGFDVHGFDASRPMLNRLLVKANAKNLKPTVWQGFIEDLAQKDKYQLIFIPSGSFCLITEKTDIQKMLQSFYEHLSDNGLLVFEVETHNAVPKELGIWRGSKWQRDDGKIILLSLLATLDDEICSSIGKYELIDGNQIIQTEIENYKIRIYHEPSYLLNQLKEIGFKEIRLVKAFDRKTSPDEHDESLVYECRK